MNKSINAKFHTLQSVFGPDHGKVAKQLKVKELARAVTKGCQNQPHTCITHDSELPIYQYHEQLLESTNTGYLVELEEKQLALAKAAEAFDVDRINEVLHAATVSYTLIKDKIDEELGEAFLKERAAYNDLLAFRDEHGLRREPSFRPDMQAALLVLSSAVLVESLINTGFFAEGSTAGYLGGFLNAALIGILNILLGYYSGIILKNLYHQAVWRKIMACAYGTLYGIGLLGFHLTVGHYRTLLVGEHPELASQAITPMLQNPFGISDMWSWMLVILGMVFAISALVTGIKVRDRYPGYGEHYLAWDDACERIKTIKDEFRNTVAELVETKKVMLEQMFDRGREAMSEYRTILMEVKQDLVQYDSVYQMIRNSYIHCIQLFRNTVYRLRQGRVPAYFSEPISEFSDSDKLQVPTDLVVNAENTIAGFPQQTDRLRTNIAEAKVTLNELATRSAKDLADVMNHLEQSAAEVTPYPGDAHATDDARHVLQIQPAM